MKQMHGTFVDRFSRFARWWIGELVGCLPERIRIKLVPNRKKLVVLIDDDRVRLERSDRDIGAKIGELTLIGTDPAQLRKVMRRIMHKARLGPRQAVLRLDRGKVLTRTVDLPIAAAENLREVLGFEMDRYTPFNAKDVCYDYRIAGTHLKRKRITVNLAVATRVAVNGAVDVARLLGVEPTQIGFVAPAKSEEASFNFLRPARARSHGPIWRGITACAALAFMLLLAGAVYLPIKLKQDALQASEVRLTRARAEAAESSRLKERLDELLEQSGFVLRQKHALTNVTELIDEVTRLLPDDTWLLQLDLKGDALELTGFAAKPSALIEVIERSPLLTNAHFTSPVTPDPKLEVDRFKLSASVAQRQRK
jgi:general secretion pathway protein L